MDSKRFDYIKRALLVALVIAIAYVVINYRDALTVEAIRAWVTSYGSLAPLAYGILYIIVLLMLLSAAAMSVLAGVLFGKFWGSVIVVVAATIAASLAFYVTRTLGKDVTSYLEGGIINKLMTKINKECETNGFRAFFILRCLFLPYIPLSYAAGLVRKAKFKDFFLGTLLTNMLFSPVFVYFGDQATQGPKAVIIPAILILLVLSVPKLVKKFK